MATPSLNRRGLREATFLCDGHIASASVVPAVCSGTHQPCRALISSSDVVTLPPSHSECLGQGSVSR